VQDVSKTKGIDWLSISLPIPSAKPLREATKIGDGDIYAKGFKQHELRECFGGMVQRHFHPHSKSSKWGMAYELWTWSGENARFSLKMMSDAQKVLPELEARCTRMDLAFDLMCSKDTSPEEITDGFREVMDARGIKVGIYCDGDPLAETRYVGSRAGERRIRIYRKDIESPSAFVLNAESGELEEVALPPRMRIELILKKDLADAVYHLAMANEDQAFEVACSEIREMTGLVMTDNVSSVEVTRKTVDSDLSAKIACMVNQYGKVLDVVRARGVDINKVLDARARELSVRGRWRQREAQERVSELSREEIEALAVIIYEDRF